MIKENDIYENSETKVRRLEKTQHSIPKSQGTLHDEENKYNIPYTSIAHLMNQNTYKTKVI